MEWKESKGERRVLLSQWQRMIAIAAATAFAGCCGTVRRIVINFIISLITTECVECLLFTNKESANGNLIATVSRPPNKNKNTTGTSFCVMDPSKTLPLPYPSPTFSKSEDFVTSGSFTRPNYFTRVKKEDHCVHQLSFSLKGME